MLKISKFFIHYFIEKLLISNKFRIKSIKFRIKNIEERIKN